MRRAAPRAACNRAGTGRTARARLRGDATSDQGAGRPRWDRGCGCSPVLLHRVARQAQLRMPEARRQPRLAAQLVEEIARVGKALPHLRQERRVELAVLEVDAVAAGLETRERLLLGRDTQPH